VQHFSFEEELSVIWSQMDRGLHFIYSLFLRDSEKNLTFHYRFSKNAHISHFTIVRLEEGESFCGGRIDGHTDRHYAANISFSQICEYA